jgi:hypothetical protein
MRRYTAKWLISAAREAIRVSLRNDSHEEPPAHTCSHSACRLMSPFLHTGGCIQSQPPHPLSAAENAAESHEAGREGTLEGSGSQTHLRPRTTVRSPRKLNHCLSLTSD